MNLGEKIYNYCERGLDPSFWAEPLNALSNAAFIVAALVAAWQLARSPRRDAAVFEWLLILVVICIGIGSFMFHTYATAWAVPFDTVPISIFMLAYLGYALRRFAGAPWIVVLATLVAFYVSVKYAQTIPCANELLPMTRGAGKRCFNGTLGYAPAFFALLLVGGWLLFARHRAAGNLLAGAVIFLAAMTFRTIDYEVCTWAVRGSRGVGTHFVWHTLNGFLLYVLLLGAIRHGAPVETARIAPAGRSAA
ncbi:MAG: ceramidase domain-containing protein [Hyphomicrobium sp.]|uniref:ceramidase domain-containing protein n=1 Tax=Hyphomicrobium sp. TaxID=82 RepID=UPI003D0D424C